MYVNTVDGGYWELNKARSDGEIGRAEKGFLFFFFNVYLYSYLLHVYLSYLYYIYLIFLCRLLIHNKCGTLFAIKEAEKGC